MKKSFKTDSDISNSKFKERELQKWQPEGEINDNLTLEHDDGNWDQFKVNKDKFGIESTYDEHLYTTRINTDAKDYHERLAKADAMAKEIENSVTSDPHIMEERGKIDDSGIDEEDKYSGVQRDEKDTRGDELMAALKSVNLDKKYIPPKPRALNTNDPAILSTTKIDKSKNSKPNESFRLNAQSEINSLKEFSATFKIPHKLPNDLLPILSKDKVKQDEILKKAVSMPSSTPSSATTTTATSTSTPTPTPASANPTTERKKMDPTKPAFNPKVASFTPSSSFKTFSPKAKSFSQASHQNHQNHQAGGQHHQNHQHHQHHQHRDRDHKTNPSPRMSTSRPYSGKRHFQVTANEFFSNKVPTKDSQLEKSKAFKVSFNMFLSRTNDNVEKAFITPPTWDLTVDESYRDLIPEPQSSILGMPMGMMSPMGMQGMPMNMQGMLMGVQGMPMQGMMQGMPMQGMPMQGMMQQMSMQGMQMPMNMQGMPVQGMPIQGMPVQGMQGMPMQFMPVFLQSPMKYSPNNYSPYNSPQPVSAQMYYEDEEYRQGVHNNSQNGENYRRYSSKR